MENEDNQEENKEIKNETKKKTRKFDGDDGFGQWGGYMAAKRSKLMDQFKDSEIPKLSNIFEGIAIHVNGLTRPPIDELKKLMAAHGGLFHMYQVSSTTHIIASNLPNVKIKHMGTTPIVKPSWITESIAYGKLLDYHRYLLYTNQSRTQPKIDFPIIEKASVSENCFKQETPDLIQLNINEIPESNSLTTPKSIISFNNSPEKKNCNNPTVPITSNPTCKQTITNICPTTKTASDPNFLEEFYNNSRLHLISTLGAEFKHLVGQMRDKSDGIFPGIQKLLKIKDNTNPSFNPNSVIMHIDMDCFFVSVSLRNHPELKGKPVAIAHARNGQITNIRPDQKANREQEFQMYSERLPIGVTSRVDKIDVHSSMSEIASCSYEARQSGLKNGMFLGQAVKMCPELITLSYDFEGIKSVSHTLYETIALYTLDIEAVSCDEMYVDITKILKETGMSVEEWAAYIRNEIMSKTGCPCSTGFGDNRLQARLATRKAKPAGQYYLKPEDLESYMVDVQLSDLPGVGRATVDKLKRMGLYTCADVQLVSLKVLQNEIGQKAGETLKEQSTGIDNKPLNFHHERKSVSAEVNYGIRFKTLEECYNFLQELSTEVFNRMNNINMRARCLTLKLLVRAAEAPLDTAKFLGHGICDSLTKSTTSNSVLNNPQMIFKEAKSLFEKLNSHFSDLRGMGLQLTKLEKNAPVNTALSKFLQSKINKNPEEPLSKNENIEWEKQKIVKESVSTEKEKPASKIDKIEGTKRGRPKGIKNRTKSNQSISINEYFGKTKNTENVFKSSQKSQGDNQISLAVLNELPEDIRKEIMKEYNLPETINERSSPKNPIENRLEEKSQKYSKRETNEKSPFSNLTWDQIKPIIRKWTESEHGPDNFDIEMIAEHFKQLAINREIEILPAIFNFMHRIFSILNCMWHQAYFKIVNITQEGMVARYGGTLLVQRQFKCCKM